MERTRTQPARTAWTDRLAHEHREFWELLLLCGATTAKRGLRLCINSSAACEVWLKKPHRTG